MTIRDIDTMHREARAKANAEPNQEGYNAAYLYGYADGIREILRQLQFEERTAPTSYVYRNGTTGEITYSPTDARDWWTRGFPVTCEPLTPDGA